MYKWSLSVALYSLCFQAAFAGDKNAEPAVNKLQAEEPEIILAMDVKWTALNPKRGDKSPQAANLWGDRTTSGPAGFLVKFADGFSSPAHIHNVSYRGVVIQGLVHNDDKNAEPMWMPTSSYWTQPAGEVHITSAKSAKNALLNGAPSAAAKQEPENYELPALASDSVAYIEIDSGPYLVKPAEKAFDNGERPVNIDAQNLFWHEADAGIEQAYLWGKNKKAHLNATLLRLPAGAAGQLKSDEGLRAVVIDGSFGYRWHPDTRAWLMQPGAYFSAKNKSQHRLLCESKKPCTLYIRAKGLYQFEPEN
ncbi:DUF4437 domain-containing protein [Agaribacterium haliotis]|uniref:DUF4437 domain-containing protein n=1 Tax=Agaribacterium haliotis TaxID=2013869 RepID=UPI00195E1455|nr:DUF4437 domain-containing protein [Agaribacterium haliotis]